MRVQCPVAHSDRYGGTWLPVRHEDVVAVAYDTEHFTSQSVVVSELRVIVKMLGFPQDDLTAFLLEAELDGNRLDPDHVRGTMVLLPFPAANRDPEVFPGVDTVQLDRVENRHAAFGLGTHRCIGSNLARMELRVALEEWVRRYPDFELTDPSKVTWSAGQVRGPRRIPVRIQ